MNQFFEAIRIVIYPASAAMLIHLAVVFPKLRFSFMGMAGYFMMWFSLLFIQLNNPDEYRVISNLVSTPGLLIVAIMILWNVLATRRE